VCVRESASWLAEGGCNSKTVEKEERAKKKAFTKRAALARKATAKKAGETSYDTSEVASGHVDGVCTNTEVNASVYMCFLSFASRCYQGKKAPESRVSLHISDYR
jgi:hypothetical protein